MQARVALYTLLLLTLLGFGQLQAQLSFHVSWDTGNVPFPRTQIFNDTVRYTLTLTNLTATPFSDTVDFQLRTTLGTFQIASFDSVNIAGFGSETFTFLDSTLASRYGGGINVVVVWPTSPSPMQTDSLRDTLRINTVSVDPPSWGQQIEVFPVPSEGEVHLRQHSQAILIRRTELVDVTGRVIRSYGGLPSMISVHDLPKAVYFIRLEDDRGQQLVLKLLKN